MYIGETWRLLKTRRKEHESKVRLTKEDIENGRIAAANERMGKEDGGLARHSVNCLSEVDWKNTSIVSKECSLRQRKVKEGIESLREIHRGTNVLNSFESLTVWRPILNKYFDSEKHLEQIFYPVRGGINNILPEATGLQKPEQSSSNKEEIHENMNCFLTEVRRFPQFASTLAPYLESKVNNFQGGQVSQCLYF